MRKVRSRGGTAVGRKHGCRGMKAGVIWRRRLRFLTGSARLFGDGQGDLCEGKDVDLWAALGGRRGQGGQVGPVLLSLSVLKLLVQRRIRRGVRVVLARPRGTPALEPAEASPPLHTGNHTSCAESCESLRFLRGGNYLRADTKTFILPHENSKDVSILRKPVVK